MTETEVPVETRRAIEAVVLAATEPVEPAVLAQLVEIPTTRVEELCEELAAEYARDGRGFVLARVAGGYRFQTHPDLSAYVERFVLDGQTARLSAAALETLAIVAYKQPIARAQLSAIRGVNVDATLRTLVQRGYVEEVGHDPGPGTPTLFGTSQAFLERLGLDSLAELPPLGDFVPEAGVVEALERGLHVGPRDEHEGEAAGSHGDDEAAPAAASVEDAAANPTGPLDDDRVDVGALEAGLRDADREARVVDVRDAADAPDPGQGADHGSARDG